MITTHNGQQSSTSITKVDYAWYVGATVHNSEGKQTDVSDLISCVNIHVVTSEFLFGVK